MTKSFRKFLEESEHIKSLERVFKIHPEDLKNDAIMAKWFQSGENGPGTNSGSYRIVDFKKNSEGEITHAVIKILSMDNVYKGDKDGKFSEMPSGGEGKEMLVPIEELDQLLQQDFKASQAQA